MNRCAVNSWGRARGHLCLAWITASPGAWLQLRVFATTTAAAGALPMIPALPLSVGIARTTGAAQADSAALPGRAGRPQDPQLHPVTGADPSGLATAGP